MAELDIGPCPFKVGDVVRVTGWAESFRGFTFEVARTKILEPEGASPAAWVVCPTYKDEVRMSEIWDKEVFGEMREGGKDAVWWWTGFLEFHSTTNLEND